MEKCKAQMETTLKLFSDLGWKINFEKSDLTPSRRKLFLGFVVDTSGPEPMLKIPYQKKRAIKKDLRALLQKAARGPVKVREVSRVCGSCQALSRAFSITPIYIRNLLRHIPEGVRKSSWNGEVSLSVKAMRDMLDWLDILETWDGQLLVPRASQGATLWTDSSDKAWGAKLGEKEAGGNWSPAEQLLHINVKELLAVARAQEVFAKELEGKATLIKIDNQVAMSYLNRMTGRVPMLAEMAKDIIETGRKKNSSFQAIYVASSQNVDADRLSRINWEHEWEVKQSTFKKLELRWGPFTIDQFASTKTTKCKRFHSRLWCPNSIGVNALSFNWREEVNWVVPPIPLIPICVRKIIQEGCNATIVVPKWPAQPWYQTLRSHAKEMIVLEPRDIVKNDSSWTKKTWNFAAFKLYGDAEKEDGAMRC